MRRWRKSLFRLLARNAQGATGYFGMPPNQVVELGVQLEI
jgi:KUP system potassium uptake protein